MKNSKTLLLSFVVLLLAVSMVLVSCNSETSSSPRKTNDEDATLVNGVVQDVAVVVDDATKSEEEKEEGTDYSKVLDPYVNELVNDLFYGENGKGTKVALGSDSYVVFKFTDASYKYDGGISKIPSIKTTFELKDVTIESGSFKAKKVSGTINYAGDPNSITGNITIDGTEYTDSKELVEFFNEVFCEDMLPACFNAFLKNGVKIEGDKISVQAKGSVKYEHTGEEVEGEEVNEYTIIEAITLTEFSLKTKDDIEIKNNKYSLEITGSAKLGFTQDKKDEDEEYLSAIAISSATLKLGVTNDTEAHTIEITTSFNYPGEVIGIKIPFTFRLSDVKIDGQQIDNASMTALLIQSLKEQF